MTLSDSDLLMLENITYITNNTKNFVPRLKDISQYKNVSAYLADFDENALDALDTMGDTIVSGGYCSGSELAAMIRYMKERDAIKSLRIIDVPVNENNSPFAFCFESPYDPSHGIVAFHGTRGPKEWKDNVLGLY